MQIYGVDFNEYETNYITKGTRTDDAESLVFEESTGLKQGIDNFNIGPYKIRECVTTFDSVTGKHKILAYKNLEKTSTYNALLSNPNNNIMIEFPCFYYQRPSKYIFKVANSYHDGFLLSPMHENADYVYISKYKINSNFKSSYNSTPLTHVNINAFKNGLKQSGLKVINYKIISAITILMLVKYADMDIQNIIGLGVQEDIANNGSSRLIKSMDGRELNDIKKPSPVITLGIENWYSNVFTYVDDISKDENNYIWLNNIKMKIPTIDSCGYISELVFDTEYPFLLYPVQITTHLEQSMRDYAYSSKYSKGIILMNGSWKGNDRSGIFSFDCMSRKNFSDKYVGAFAYFTSNDVVSE